MKGIDVEAKLALLNRLMANDKLYCNESLTLATLAEALDLSSHQASELINPLRHRLLPTRQKQRVAEAKKFLTEDQRSSVILPIHLGPHIVQGAL